MAIDPTVTVPGDVYVFPLPNGMRGACRVVHKRNDGDVFVVALRWTGNESQTPSAAEARNALTLTHHNIEAEPCSAWIAPPPPPEFELVRRGITRTADGAPPITGSMKWVYITMHTWIQWQWENDRAAVLSQDAQREAQIERESVAYYRRLDATTLPTLRRRLWFKSWVGSHAAPFARKSRAIIRSLVDDISALGGTPTRRDVMKAVRRGVEAFNQLERDGMPIESIERDDICGSFFEVVYVAGVRNLADPTERWREW
jgi:hypothetical protein